MRRRGRARAEAISAKMIKQQGGKTGGETLEERIANLFLTVGIPGTHQGLSVFARGGAHGDG